MTVQLSQFSGLLFDWDGVIVNSADAHEKSWELLAHQESLNLPADHFKKGFGMRNEQVIPEVLMWTEDPDEIQRLSFAKEVFYREIIKREGIRPLPGVIVLMEQLKQQKIKIAIASSTHRKNIEISLEVLRLSSQVNAIVSSEDVQQGKPHPQVFQVAAKKLGLMPSKCLVIEDAPVGIIAGKDAGCTVIAVATSHPKSRLKEADWVVESLEELSV